MYMFVHTNRCFCDTFVSANIWLIMLHDHLHCLVFKEHLCVISEVFDWSLVNQLLYDTSSIPFCQELFYFFFEEIFEESCAGNAVLSLSVADLHYITRFALVCQHLWKIFFAPAEVKTCSLFCPARDSHHRFAPPSEREAKRQKAVALSRNG